MAAEGGIITTIGGYRIHTFKSSDTFIAQVGPSLTASQQFIISGLTTGTYNICPDPN